MIPLSERLKNWNDFDGAEYALGVVLGIFPDTPEEGFWLHQAPKWVFWSKNPLGNALYEMLRKLVDVGIIEENDDGQLRWKGETVVELLNPKL